MVKKLQVFVSSTFIDLKDERQKAVEGILKAGHIPAGMELFTADSRNQWDVIQDWIKESDVLMLILGGRYGSVEPSTGISYTEMEYRFALENNIPVFAVVLNDQFLADKKSKNINLEVYEKAEPQKYEAFKQLATSNLVEFVANIDQIKSEVSFSLNKFMREDESRYKFRGWVRPSDLANTQVAVAKEPQTNKLFEKDVDLLDKIINEFQSQGFIDNIEHISTYCSYDRDMKRVLDEFVWFCDLPTTRFFNDDLQELLNAVVKSIKEFSTFLSLHFFSSKDLIGMHLYPDLNQDFGYVDPKLQKRYDKHLDSLSNVAHNTVNEIKKFVFEGQKTLYS